MQFLLLTSSVASVALAMSLFSLNLISQVNQLTNTAALASSMNQIMYGGGSSSAASASAATTTSAAASSSATQAASSTSSGDANKLGNFFGYSALFGAGLVALL